MLEILADTEVIRRDVVVHHVILHFLLDFLLGSRRVVDQAGAIADFGVEELTGGKSLVGINELQDFVGHFVVSAPGHILVALGDLHGLHVNLFAEDFGRIDRESGTGFEVRNGFNGVEGKVMVHIFEIFVQRYEETDSYKKTRKMAAFLRLPPN